MPYIFLREKNTDSRVEQDVVEALGLDTDLDGLVTVLLAIDVTVGTVMSVSVDGLVSGVSLGVFGLVGRVGGVQSSEVRGQGEGTVDGRLRSGGFEVMSVGKFR